MSAREIEPMVQFYEDIFTRVVERILEKRNARFPSVDEETATRIARINAKPYITVQEAEVLLGCSASHLYKRITQTKKGAAKSPIPFLDLDGVYVLPREPLLLWAQETKPQERKRRKGPKALQSEGRND